MRNLWTGTEPIGVDLVSALCSGRCNTYLSSLLWAFDLHLSSEVCQITFENVWFLDSFFNATVNTRFDSALCSGAVRTKTDG